MANRIQRIRGQEASIRVMHLTSGVIVPLEGSFFKTRDFQWSDRGDITEDGFLGEVADDLDYQNHGFDGSFTIDKGDTAAIDYVTTLVATDRASVKPPEITLVVTYKYRQLGLAGTVQIFSEGIMKMATENVGGRKDWITNAFEWKAKHRLQRIG